MSSTPFDKLTPTEKEQLAVSYAAFILHGTGTKTTADSLNAVLNAAGVPASASIVKAVAKTLSTRAVTDLFGSGSSADAPAAVKAPVVKEKEAPKAPEKKQDKKAAKNAPAPPPPEEDEGMDMGGLFG